MFVAFVGGFGAAFACRFVAGGATTGAAGGAGEGGGRETESEDGEQKVLFHGFDDDGFG
jgi:hypothetical protein